MTSPPLHPTPRMSLRSHPTLRRSAASLPIGLAITIILTVGASLFNRDIADPTAMRGVAFVLPEPAGGKGSGFVNLTSFEQWGVTFAYSGLLLDAPGVKQPEPASLTRRPRDWRGRVLVPWATGPDAWPTGQRAERMEVKAAGWPWRAAWCEVKAERLPSRGGHIWRVAGGLALDQDIRVAAPSAWPPDYPGIIPLRPLWLGLLGNVAVWSSAWAALAWGPGGLIRWRRRRSNRCERCGYSLAGLASPTLCPECAYPTITSAGPQPSRAGA